MLNQKLWKLYWIRKTVELDQIKDKLSVAVPGSIIGEDQNSTPYTLQIDPTQIKAVCYWLRDTEEVYFDMLSCLTGIDNGVESNSMEVIYHLYSIPYNIQLALKVIIDRSEPKIDSVNEIWKTADWHERECYDLLGIHFEGHPDLRRILLPEDWEGHPLRKDYQEQDKYHGIKVDY